MAHITAILNSGMRVEITNGRHQWFADEPSSVGGTDGGPSPYEMLIGSLAACTTITLQLYARHKGINLEWIKAEYQFARATGADGKHHGAERITAHITIGGTFNDAERNRLEQITARCPVHRTLTSGIEIIDYVTFTDKQPGSASLVETPN